MPDNAQTTARHLADRTAPLSAVPRDGKHYKTLRTPRRFTVAALVKQHAGTKA